MDPITEMATKCLPHIYSMNMPDEVIISSGMKQDGARFYPAT